MKYFFNSMLMLSLFVSIGTGTTSVWHCLKNDTLSLNLDCSEVDTDKKQNSCCAKKVTRQNKLDSLCCEELEQSNLTPVNSSSSFEVQPTQVVILAFINFEVLDKRPTLSKFYIRSKAPPTSRSISTYKLHCSFLC
jgi:hypothetical protein